MKRVLILTGVSGSGKSTAIKALEDIEFYCVDNLPPTLIPQFIDLCLYSEKTIDNVAVVIDIRIPDRSILRDMDNIINEVKNKDIKVELLFLDSSDNVLLRRFKETRRRHLLAVDGDILDGIRQERELLSNLRNIADMTVDTSDFNPHELRAYIQNRFSTGVRDLSLNFLSFGFKHGAPLEADIIIDVRFLPNPNFVPELKTLDGNNKKVEDYVLKNITTSIFIDKFGELLDFLIPQYKAEGKTYLNIAIGCTGGKHRSVVIINKLSDKFRKYNPTKKHRDISKNQEQ